MGRDKESNNFIAHFLAIGSGTIINMILGLLSTPIITRLVDPEEYGQLSIFDMYTSIALMVLCIGLDQALVRFFYEKEDMSYKRALYRFCFFIPMIVSLVAATGVTLLALFNNKLFEFEPLIMFFLCINVIVSIWNRLSLLLLRITYQSKKYAICNVLHRVVYLAVALGLIYLLKSNYLRILTFATFFSLIVPSVVAMFFTKEYQSFSGKIKLENKKEVILYGLPFILSMGITTLFQACDKIALNYFRTYSEVGVYSSAMTIVSIFAIVQSTFNAIWSPMMIEQLTKNPEDKTLIQKVNKYITVIMFFIGLCLIFGKDLFALLLGEKYREAAYIFPFLIFNPIMYTISETTQPGIEYSKKSYFNIVVALIACITNIIGNFLLVPKLGCQGAAISTGISYIVFFATRTVISNRYYYVDYKLWKFIILTLVTIGYAYYNTFYAFNWFSVVGFFLCVGILFVLYFKDIIELFKVFLRQIKLLTKKERNK